jgi:sulfoxide reductase catalytic subunit YedY
MANSWNLPEREVSPESALRSRRAWLRWALFGGALAAGAGTSLWWLFDRGTDEEVIQAGKYDWPGADLYPARGNAKFAAVDRPVTVESQAARYSNFYEFSGGKSVWRWISSFQPVPWKVEVTGLAARPRTFDIDDLLRAFPLEERIYRHRCVEAWAMVVPWTGFPLARLIEKVRPLPEARYVRFVSFHEPEQASKQRSSSYPWPYTEGLTLKEATNELTFLATGMYDHPLLKQHGAPLRLVVPWKYGFKSAKSIVRIELTAERPATFWNTVSPEEYGFESNVNPNKPHPRWSQASERMLGTDERHATVLYNGYGEWVAHLYKS